MNYALAAGSFLNSPIGIILIYVVIIGGFWFILMRPQKKEQKRLAAMIADMEVGDTVLTTSGFYGMVIDINEETIIVEFGNNKNCRIPMQKAAISMVEKPENARYSEPKFNIAEAALERLLKQEKTAQTAR